MARAPSTAFFPRLPRLRGESGISQLVDTTFRSSALDREMPILVYLPPGYYESSRRYPVLYMLGGFTGSYREWVNWGICDALEWLIRGGHIQPLIVVLPEGDNSFWFNHAPVPGSEGKPWGDYVWRDVVSYVDLNFRTVRARESRAVGGLSAGGQAALAFALTHPEVFSIVGAHSPSVRRADGSLVFFGDQEYYNQFDPVWLFQNTTTWDQLTIWIDVGAEDNQWGGPAFDLHMMLRERGIPHEFHNEWHGIHDNYYWTPHIPDYVDWYASKLASEEAR